MLQSSDNTEYTPTTEEVAFCFEGEHDPQPRRAVFDRWLSKVRAEAKAEALEEAASAYPVMLRDMVSRPSVAAWLRDRAKQYSQEADE